MTLKIIEYRDHLIEFYPPDLRHKTTDVRDKIHIYKDGNVITRILIPVESEEDAKRVLDRHLLGKL